MCGICLKVCVIYIVYNLQGTVVHVRLNVVHVYKKNISVQEKYKLYIKNMFSLDLDHHVIVFF